jgi:NAD(P)H-dependent FMN reductase
VSVRTLLLIAHAPSPNTRLLRDALITGARREAGTVAVVRALNPFEAQPADVLAADGVLLFTPENLGYMSGALKDFFDRIYYPTLDHKQGLPYALVIRAGHDGAGTQRAVQTIVTGLRWRAVAEALVLRGKFQDRWRQDCEERAAGLAAGIGAGVL